MGRSKVNGNQERINVIYVPIEQYYTKNDKVMQKSMWACYDRTRNMKTMARGVVGNQVFFFTHMEL